MLDRYFPAGCFFAPRLMEESAPRSMRAAQRLEARSANTLACMGDMPLICHRGALSPAGLALMAAAGLAPARQAVAYVTRQDYLDRMAELAGRGQRAVNLYWGAPETEGGMPYLDPAILRALNDKANLADLVPAENVPRRRAVSVADLADPRLREELSRSVLKAASSLPVGGGAGIRMPRRRSFRAGRAAKAMRDAEAVIVEECLDIADNHCVQFAVSAAGDVSYLGWAAQICHRGGVHVGNLLDPRAAPRQEVVALGWEIARRGAERGFRGIAGFDIVVTRDGRVLAIDLNFRLVSSTPQVLLHPALARERGLPVSRLAFATFAGDFGRMLKSMERGVAAGWLVPLATFDPRYGHMGKGRSRARLLIFGASKGDIGEREVELERLGFDLAGKMPPLGSRLLRLLGPRS